MLSIVKSFTEKESGPLTLDAVVGGSWINAVAPTGEELETISKITGVQRDLLVAALDIEETSRIEVEDNAILVVINIAKACGNFNFDAIPLASSSRPTISLRSVWRRTTSSRESPEASTASVRTSGRAFCFRSSSRRRPCSSST